WLRGVSCRTRKNCPRWSPTSTTDGASRSARRGGIADRPDCGRRVGRAEDRRARDEGGGAVVRERLRERGPDAPVDGDVDAAAAEERPDLADLAMRARDERLAAEPWVDRHHEDEIEVVQDVLEHRRRRRGIERDARLRAELPDLGERA